MKFFISLFSMFLSTQAVAIAQSVPSIQDYAALPNMANVRISPNGEKLAFISGDNWEERSIIITSLNGSSSPVVIDVGDDQVVTRLFFVSNDHIWLTYLDRGQYRFMRDEGYVAREYIVRIADQNVVELDYGTYFASLNEAEPDTVLTWVPAQRRAGSIGTRVRGGAGYSLFAQSLDSMSKSRRALGVRDFEYLLDANDQPVIRQRGGNDSDDPYEFWSSTTGSGGNWERQHVERFELDREFHFAARHTQEWIGVIPWISGLDANGRYAYYFSKTMGERETRTPGQRWALFRYDLEEGQIDGIVERSEMSDITSPLRDWRTNSIIGVQWNEERKQVRYFDPEFAALQTQIESYFPDSNITIVSWDRSFRRVILNISGGHTAGTYYLIDRETGDVNLISHARPRVPDDAISPVEIVHYQARDGMNLFGYLTLPAGQEAQNLPMVLMPHGGPEARDYYGYDEWAQLIASRGYAVFQPQFRGSGGFGVEFAESGYGNWGEEMQHDLDDGVDVLIERGIIDSERVCIFGWSYGGYATLAGMTFTPERYRCGIAGAGVSSIVAMMQFAQSQHGGGSWAYWARNIGDWRGNGRVAIDAVSPALHASNIQSPLMIIHGTGDLIVDYSQAEIMAAAMEAADKPYELITIEDGPHYSIRMTIPQKLQLYENLLRFLFEHNPPDPVEH